MVIYLKDIILASKSIDRKELFKKARIPFIVISPDLNEEKFKRNINDPYYLVQELAKAKVLNVKKKVKKLYNDAIIISADTIVEFEGEIIGKARDEKHAFKILKKLVDKTHKLITGYAIMDLKEEKIIVDYDQTLVKFLNLSDNEIWSYIRSKEWIGKAGAYSLRERASMFVQSIDGSYSNVLGLPMQQLYQILKNEFNLDLLE